MIGCADNSCLSDVERCSLVKMMFELEIRVIEPMKNKGSSMPSPYWVCGTNAIGVSKYVDQNFIYFNHS